MPKFNQKGIIHLIPLFILLLGIVAGVYLVQHPTIFKPKAQEPSQGVDYADWVTQMQAFGVYPAQENGEIVFYNREKFVEKYCQPQGCYLNPITFDQMLNAINLDASFIKDLGLKLSEYEYAPLTVLTPYFPEIINIDKSVYQQLEVLEPSCREEDSGLVCRPGQENFKKEINKEELRRFITMVSTEKGLQEKDPLKRLINISDPIFGTRALINVLSLAPNKVSDEDRLNALLGITMLFGIPERIEAEGIELADDTIIVINNVIKDIRPFKKSIDAGERMPLASVDVRANGWVQKSRAVGRKIPGLSMRNVARMTRHERFRFSQIYPLLQTGEAYILDSNDSKQVMQRLMDGVEYIYGPSGLPKLDRKAIMETVDNNWVVVIKDDQYVRIYGNNNNGATQDRLVAVKESAVSGNHTIPHEFVHVIGYNSGGFKGVGKYFTYDQRQAEIYGATMSQMYELFTDEVTYKVFGDQNGVYKEIYPQLYDSLMRFADNLMVATRGRVTRNDFAIFSLTGNDQILMKKLLDNGVNPAKFMNILGKSIDGRKLAMIMAEYRKVQLTDRVKSLSVPAAIAGGAFLSAVLTQIVYGEELPDDVSIIYERLDKDVDISLENSRSENSLLNCSYSEASDNCSSGFQVCTGYTDDSQCQGKTPEECFNLVHCNYDVDRGSSCRCSQ